MDAMDLAQQNEDARASENHFKAKAALLVSVLAMILAISNIGSSNASSDSTEKNILAANTYSFYQAKNIRQTEYKLFSDLVQMEIAKDPKLNSEARALMEKKLDGYAKNIQRYESEPETGEGKKELLQKAKEFEQIRDLAMRRDPWFDYAEGLLQVGIVLASVSIITSTPLLLTGALVVGFLGSLSTLNGFYLFIG